VLIASELSLLTPQSHVHNVDGQRQQVRLLRRSLDDCLIESGQRCQVACGEQGWRQPVNLSWVAMDVLVSVAAGVVAACRARAVVAARVLPQGM
jgi:hypothetical protein